MSNIDLSVDIKDDAKQWLRLLLPLGWQQALASIGLLAIVASSKAGGFGYLVAACGAGFVSAAFFSRLFIRLRLSAYAKSIRFSSDLQNVANSKIHYHSRVISYKDELIALFIESTKAPPHMFKHSDLPVRVVVVRRIAGLWTPIMSQDASSDVLLLVGSDRLWNRLATLLPAASGTYLYLLTPSYGNRSANRFAFVSLYDIERKSLPTSFSFASSDSDPMLWRGRVQVDVESAVPDSIKRVVVKLMAEAGFASSAASSLDLASRRWQAEFSGGDEITLPDEWTAPELHARLDSKDKNQPFECGEPNAVVGDSRFYGGWRDDPVFEVNPHGQFRVITIAQSWIKFVAFDGVLVLADARGICAYDPLTRRLKQLSNEFEASLVVNDNQLEITHLNKSPTIITPMIADFKNKVIADSRERRRFD